MLMGMEALPEVRCFFCAPLAPSSISSSNTPSAARLLAFDALSSCSFRKAH
jgi:hypothetical protein